MGMSPTVACTLIDQRRQRQLHVTQNAYSPVTPNILYIDIKSQLLHRKKKNAITIKRLFCTMQISYICKTRLGLNVVFVFNICYILEAEH